MYLLISFNHDIPFTQERREEGRYLSENLCGYTLCIYRVEKVTTLYNIVTIVVQYQTSRLLLTMAWQNGDVPL